MFTKEELNNLYNCVTIVITNRERDNEVSSMFDDDFHDPIIEQLKDLELKLETILIDGEYDD